MNQLILILILIKVLVVLGIVASIYVIRATLIADGFTPSSAQTLASVVNALQIQVANWGYVRYMRVCCYLFCLLFVGLWVCGSVGPWVRGLWVSIRTKRKLFEWTSGYAMLSPKKGWDQSCPVLFCPCSVPKRDGILRIHLYTVSRITHH